MPVLSSSTPLDAATRAAWQSQVAAAKHTPGLLPLLVHQRHDLLPRFASLYAHLRALPKYLRRQWQRRYRASLAGVALALALGHGSAWADTITVNAGCSLINAITTANTDTNTGGCVQTGTVSAADTIVLPGNSMQTLMAVDNTTFGPTGLPVVSSEITIEGNNSTIMRDGGAPDFRLLAINSTGNLTIQDTTLSGGKMPDAGRGYDDGGGIANYFGQLRLEGCTVSGNSAYLSGGGVFSFTDGSDAVVILDTTLNGNSAGGSGGGVWSLTLDASRVTLSNSTLSGNSAGSAGGGVYSRTFDTSTVTLSRMLIAGNTAGSAGDEVRRVNLGGALTAANYNLFGHSGLTNAAAFSDFTPGATDLTATSDGTDPTALTDILDTTLANNGGPTLTHNLVAGSPAIDASPDDADCPPTDQRGVPRPQGPACDIGAADPAPAQGW